MKFKNEESYTLTTRDYISVAFKQLPVNALIHKGRCGIGGTTLETDDKSRNTIIIVPTKGIIDSKTIVGKDDSEEEQIRKESIFPIRKDTSETEILRWLTSSEIGKKCMVIPDNFERIIKVVEKNDLFNHLYNNYFLLVDEAHSLITEDYRDKMLVPLEYFWEFKDKSLISATPYLFSDPRFRELEYHKIIFEDPDSIVTYIDDIDVIEAKNIYATLKQVIDTTNGKKHIFLNSVTDIAETIRAFDLQDCNVYCNEKKDNLKKLEFRNGCFKPMAITGEYAEFNFHTTKGFEGWDLKDENATLILMTDVHKEHTRVGLSNKGVQALGRIRSPNHKLIHITNHRYKKSMKTEEEISREYAIRAEQQIKKYNEILEVYKLSGLTPTEEEVTIVEKYAEVDKSTKIATFKHQKLDQLVNRQIGDEQYNDISFIKKVWLDAGFNVTHKKSSVTKERGEQPLNKRISKANLFKQIIDKISSLYKEKKEFVINNSDEQLSILKQNFPLQYRAYHVLGIERVKAANFNEKAIERQLIEQLDIDAEPKLMKYLDLEFKVHQRYSKSEIKNKLSSLYQKLGISRIATAEQLGEKGRFDILECKMKDKDGKVINGFVIMRKQFELKTAA